MFSTEGDGKRIRIHKTLWVHYGGADVHQEGEELVLAGRDEDSYLKVLNHFGRVLKLFTFDANRWVDAETGAPPGPLDTAMAGVVPAPPPGRPAAKAAPAKGKKPGKASAASAPAGKKVATPKPGSNRKTAAAGKGGAKKATGGSAPKKSSPTAAKKSPSKR
ncbi:MAG: hypothetical protein V3S29_04880 [bacterium]